MAESEDGKGELKMGLTANQQELIKAVSENDIRLAKRCAIDCIAEDATQKNRWFCRKYGEILQGSGANMIDLPSDLKPFLCAEDVSKSFREGRYYISERERAVLENIVRMNKVKGRLMEMCIPYLNSTLLYGESGTGKTTFGRYVAYKMKVPFCYLNFSHLVDSYMGNTSKNLDKAFGYAMSNPCVFMLDEIDCISIRRSDAGEGGSSAEMGRVTITLMQEFDKLTNDCVVIGATNRMDRLDPALLRRFSIKHEVKPLNGSEKKRLAERFLDDVGMNFPENDVAGLVEGSEGPSALVNGLIRLISCKIYHDISDTNDKDL